MISALFELLTNAETVSCNPGWLRTHCIAEDDLTTTSRVPGLQAWAIMSSFMQCRRQNQGLVHVKQTFYQLSYSPRHKYVFPWCYTFESPFEFAMYFLSEVTHAPWGCLYRNFSVEKRWDHTSRRPFISQGGRSWEEMAGSVFHWGWLAVRFPGALQASVCPSDQCPDRLLWHQARSSTVFCLPLLFPGCPSSALRLRVGWRQQSHIPSAGGTHWPVKWGGKKASEVEGQGNLCCSVWAGSASLPRLLRSLTHPTPHLKTAVGLD